MESRKKGLSPKHPYTLDSACSLASILNRQRDYKSVEELHRQTLSRRESDSELPQNHPDILASKAGLAICLSAQGKYAETEKLHSEVLLSREKHGVALPDTLASVQALAQLYQRQGSYEQSFVLYQRACNGYEKVFGSDHPITVDCLTQFRSMKGKRKVDEIDSSGTSKRVPL